MDTEKEYHELSFYTLTHSDAAFIHQHIVDAQTAQMANENTKPISLVFSLIGLYLYLERNLSGRQVQQIHSKMAQNKISWPKIPLPATRGHINSGDVLMVAPGQKRDEMIKNWCESVWEAYNESRAVIVELAQQYNI